MFRWQRVKALSFLANLLNFNRLHPKPLKKTPHILWFFSWHSTPFFVYSTYPKASSYHLSLKSSLLPIFSSCALSSGKLPPFFESIFLQTPWYEIEWQSPLSDGSTFTILQISSLRHKYLWGLCQIWLVGQTGVVSGWRNSRRRDDRCFVLLLPMTIRSFPRAWKRSFRKASTTRPADKT